MSEKPTPEQEALINETAHKYNAMRGKELAWSAIQSAAEKLQRDPVELAESLADGKLATVVADALEGALEIRAFAVEAVTSRWDDEPSARSADREATGLEDDCRAALSLLQGGK